MIRWAVAPLLVLLLGADWPTFQGDYRRSGTSAESVPVPLAEAWRHTARHAAAPAWPEPAREDVYNQHPRIRAVVAYDRAYQVVVAGETVYFGSSADDKVYALEAATGRELWSFFTGGPVRLAPTVADGLLYVGSDDGAVYCLRAASGELVWKRRVHEPPACVPGNGRMISLWPVRSSIVVDDGLAYAAAGLFPNEGVYLAALDAQDGTVRWNRKIDVSAQGYMLASKDRLYVPTGRTAPAIFARDGGAFLGKMPQGGGGAVLLDARDVASGPTLRPPGISVGDERSQTVAATFDGLRMVVDGATAYLQSEDKLTALDRVRYVALSREANDLAEEQKRLKAAGKAQEKKADAGERLDAIQSRLNEIAAARKTCFRWSVRCDCSLAMILAGKRLFLGGQDKLIAVDCADGKTIWSEAVSGAAYGLAASGGRLWASTDQGVIHCFEAAKAPGGSESAPSPAPLAQAPADHAAIPSVDDRHGHTAQRVLDATDVRQGYCIVLGAGGGGLACELARRSDLHLVLIEPDPEKVTAARRVLDEAGLQGVRATVVQAALDDLPLPDYCANLIVGGDVSDSGRLPPSAAEVGRILRPHGGMAVFAAPDNRAELAAWKAWGENVLSAWRVESGQGFVLASARRGPLDGAGEWTHAYADPANTASSGDRLVGAPMRVQWFGRPGPRQMIDRHFRNLPPLCKEGRLFVPGREILYAVDAYNGTIYWEAEVPGFLRLGPILDSNSIAVDKDYVYMAVADQCVRLNVVDGRRDVLARLADDARRDATDEWGYLAVTGPVLLGSGRSSKAAYRELTRTAQIDTMSQWYPNMKVALSQRLFALDRATGRLLWRYGQGRVIDTTLTVGAGNLYFLESRNSAALADHSGRMTMRQLIDGEQVFLVALDTLSGDVRFEQKLDVRDLEQMAYLGFAENTLLLSGSKIVNGGQIVASGTAGLAQYRGNERVHYYFQAFDPATGQPRWRQDHDTDLRADGGHGELNRHPTLIGRIAYTWPYAYDLQTGRRVEGWVFERRGGGCGNISASAECLFWRGSNPWMYDLRPGGGPVRLNQVSRPGCFINIIPAGGLVLIPEASSGCTCAYPMQMSIAYAKRAP